VTRATLSLGIGLLLLLGAGIYVWTGAAAEAERGVMPWNILGYIKSTWPERIQDMQAVRTEGETRSREN